MNKNEIPPLSELDPGVTDDGIAMVTVMGPVNETDGYGMLSIEAPRRLDSDGVPDMDTAALDLPILKRCAEAALAAMQLLCEGKNPVVVDAKLLWWAQSVIQVTCKGSNVDQALQAALDAAKERK